MKWKKPAHRKLKETTQTTGIESGFVKDKQPNPDELSAAENGIEADVQLSHEEIRASDIDRVEADLQPDPNGMLSADGEAASEAPNAKKAQKPGLARRLVSNLLIVAGILLIVVPFVITRLNASRNEDIIDQFLKEADQAASQTEGLAGENVDSFYENDVDFSSELNPSATPVPTATPEATLDPFVSPEPSASPAADPQPPAPTKKPIMSKAEIQKRMTGVLIIDKIDLKMVIMDGVDEETLRVAAGRMPETGQFDEIGNVVLAGHRSYTFDKYFNRLDELDVGDEIVVKTKTKTLKYVIYKKHIVEPNDFSITKGNDTDKILTLFTCHPVMIASHRLVVHAKQVE